MLLPRHRFGREKTPSYTEIKDRLEQARALAVARPKQMSPKEKVQEASTRMSPRVLNNLTRIVHDKKRGKEIRVEAANVILKAGYGEPDNADG